MASTQRSASSNATNGRQSVADGRSVDAQLPRSQPAANADPTRDVSPPATLREEFGGVRLLVGDIRTASLLVNAARHRIIGGLFGVPREQENLLTLVAVLTMAGWTQRRIERLMRTPPEAGETLLGAASLREVLCAVAGPSSRETPMTGTLLAIAVAAGAASPAVIKSVHGIRSSSHRLVVGFHRRYGYVVDPGHWRARRAASWRA